jgi:hypothetical protein
MAHGTLCAEENAAGKPIEGEVRHYFYGCFSRECTDFATVRPIARSQAAKRA